MALYTLYEYEDCLIFLENKNNKKFVGYWLTFQRDYRSRYDPVRLSFFFFISQEYVRHLVEIPVFLDQIKNREVISRDTGTYLIHLSRRQKISRLRVKKTSRLRIVSYSWDTLLFDLVELRFGIVSVSVTVKGKKRWEEFRKRSSVVSHQFEFSLA